MSEGRKLRAEIEALKAALVPPGAEAALAGDIAFSDNGAPGHELRRVLGELHRRLAEAAPMAEEEIAAHPLAAVAAAFLLGLVLGRLSTWA